MPVKYPTKYVYQIRCRNGTVVDNLQILGQDEEEAKRKLFQMYTNSTILNMTIAESTRGSTLSYEEVLDLITDSNE